MMLQALTITNKCMHMHNECLGLHNAESTHTHTRLSQMHLQKSKNSNKIFLFYTKTSINLQWCNIKLEHH